MNWQFWLIYIYFRNGCIRTSVQCFCIVYFPYFSVCVRVRKFVQCFCIVYCVYFPACVGVREFVQFFHTLMCGFSACVRVGEFVQWYCIVYKSRTIFSACLRVREFVQYFFQKYFLSYESCISFITPITANNYFIHRSNSVSSTTFFHFFLS